MTERIVDEAREFKESLEISFSRIGAKLEDAISERVTEAGKRAVSLEVAKAVSEAVDAVIKFRSVDTEATINKIVEVFEKALDNAERDGI